MLLHDGVAKLLLVTVLRQALAAAPIVRIKNAVDGINFHALGGHRTVSEQPPRALTLVAGDVQRIISQPIS